VSLGLEPMGGQRNVTKEDERIERGGCKGAEVRRLGKLECIVGEINDFVFDTFLKLQPVE
jgi:hypothetical protein